MVSGKENKITITGYNLIKVLELFKLKKMMDIQEHVMSWNLIKVFIWFK